MEQRVTSEAENPRLKSIGYGGTIMSRPSQITGKMYLEPRPDSLQILDSMVGLELREKFSSMTLECGTLIDSSQATADRHIVDIVRDIRKRLINDEADIFIVLYGTDTMADAIAAMGNGISKQELGNKTVIVTGSMRHLESEDPPSDARTNFVNAVTLAAMEESRGKIGLLFGERFFPPRGIEKIRNGQRFPFQCRFHRMAKFSDEEGKWIFRDSRPFDEPMGTSGIPYRLTLGVETCALTATSDYSKIAHIVSENKATVLLAPGDGNLRTDKESIKALCDATEKAKGPIVVVADALQDAEDELLPDAEWQDAVYQGHAYSDAVHKLIPGGAMTKTEARLLLSQHIANMESKGINREDYMDYITSIIATYPFRDANTDIH